MKGFKLNSVNQSTYFSFAAFLLIFIIVTSTKYHLINTNALILDDMEFYFNSIFGSANTDYDFANSIFDFYSFHNKLLLYPHYVRLFYVGLLSLCAAFTFILINRLLKAAFPSLLIVLVVFLHPTSAIMILFINGSYNVLFYLLFSAGLAALAGFVLDYNIRKSFIAKTSMYLLGVFLICFSLKFTTNGILLPLSLFFLPWWKCNVIKENRKEFAVYGLVTCLLFIISILVQISKLGHHPYSQMPGRISYNPVSMLNNFLILCSNVISSYIYPQTNTGIPYTATTTMAVIAASVAILFVIIICALIIKSSKQTGTELSSNQHIAGFVPFLVSLIALSIVPLTPNVLIHLWHYFLPAIFVMLFLLLLIYKFTTSKIFCTVTALIVFASIFNLKQQIKQYETSLSEQEKLIFFVTSEKSKWIEDCQVIIITSKFPYLSGFGGTAVRDREYLKYISGRPDIRFASIGPQEIINKNNSKFALGSSIPTYLYKFDYAANVAEKISHLLVTKGSSVAIYSASDSGIKKETDEKPQQDELSLFRTLNIAQSDVINMAIRQ